MDPVVIAAGVGAWATVAAAWLDMRGRTNGRGPLGAKLDRLEGILLRHLESHGRD